MLGPEEREIYIEELLVVLHDPFVQPLPGTGNERIDEQHREQFRLRNERLRQLLKNLYRKHFDDGALLAFTQFYRSFEGQQVAAIQQRIVAELHELLPAVSEEIMQELQQVQESTGNANSLTVQPVDDPDRANTRLTEILQKRSPSD